jgi:hypothetical protein
MLVFPYRVSCRYNCSTQRHETAMAFLETRPRAHAPTRLTSNGIFSVMGNTITLYKRICPTTCHEGAWGKRRYSSYSFSTSALDGGEWSASRPGRAFTPGERTPGTYCTGAWVGPRAGLDTEVRGNNPLPPPGIEPRSPGRPARSQILYCLS